MGTLIFYCSIVLGITVYSMWNSYNKRKMWEAYYKRDRMNDVTPDGKLIVDVNGTEKIKEL